MLRALFIPFFIAVLLLQFSVGAQIISSTRIRSLTIDDGLPQGFITGFVQDEHGFIWLSTRDGLARYDGKSVKVFYHNSEDSNSLTSSVIRYLSIDKKNNIWIQYDNDAIDILNPVSEKIRHLSNEHAFIALVADKRDEIFSKAHFDNQDNAFILYDYKQQHEGELICVDRQQKKLRKFALPINEAGLNIDNDTSGNIWLSSQRSLYILSNEQLKKICNLPEKLQSELQ